MPRVSKFKLPPVNTGGESIGQRLARIRKERGYTQKQLAERIGLIQELISRYEKEKIRLTVEMLIRLLDALDVSADEFLGRDQMKAESNRVNLRLVKRMQRIERLPTSKQKTILSSLDMMLDSAEKKGE
jgi:transcriptional regulator with XRE-family HTH domain